MEHVKEYRNPAIIMALSRKIRTSGGGNITIMEVCGGHTLAIMRGGIKALLPDRINLISGPGCPVCVTSSGYIDSLIEFAAGENRIIATYGDLMKVPGLNSSLLEARSKGADIRVIYSATEALEIARENPQKEILFPAIGFETTSPATAVVVSNASQLKVNNFAILSAHKIMPPAMRAIVSGDHRISGFMAPGHVSAITGSTIFQFIAKDFGIPVVITGFEPTDILHSLLMIDTMIRTKKPDVLIQYSRAVTERGNRKALSLLNEVFEPCDDWWRGFGIIPGSGLVVRKKYAQYDGRIKYGLKPLSNDEPAGCICGQVLKGTSNPNDCPLFDNICSPGNPVGACMVSAEGSCSTYYRYGRNR